MTDLIYMLVSQPVSVDDVLMSRPLDIGGVMSILSPIRDGTEVLGEPPWIKPSAGWRRKLRAKGRCLPSSEACSGGHAITCHPDSMYERVQPTQDGPVPVQTEFGIDPQP